MKSASLITILVGVSSILYAQNTKAADTTFDGTWQVTLYTPEHEDPRTGVVAANYIIYFPANVKNGVLHGDWRSEDASHWLEINGKIGADGKAILHLNGITGPSQYTLGNPSTGESHVHPGTPYAYDVNAHFKGRHGTGERIGGRIGIHRRPMLFYNVVDDGAVH